MPYIMLLGPFVTIRVPKMIQRLLKKNKKMVKEFKSYFNPHLPWLISMTISSDETSN